MLFVITNLKEICTIEMKGSVMKKLLTVVFFMFFLINASITKAQIENNIA